MIRFQILRENFEARIETLKANLEANYLVRIRELGGELARETEAKNLAQKVRKSYFIP